MIRWTPDKDQIVIANRGVINAEEIGKLLGISGDAVRARAVRLGLPRPISCTWTPEQDRFVIESRANGMTRQAIAKELGFTLRRVTGRISRLKLPLLEVRPPGGQKSWTDERDQFLKDNIATMSGTEVGKHLGLSRGAISGRCYRLGIVIPRKVSTKPRAVKRPKVLKERQPPKPRGALREFVSPPIPVEPLNIPFIDLAPHHCREIVGSLGYGQSLSCGHPVIEGSSWCRWHASLNFTKPESRSRPYFRVAA